MRRYKLLLAVVLVVLALSEPKPDSEQPDPKLISPDGKPLTISYDGYGREIYVEEFRDGRPYLWYTYDSKGHRQRFLRSPGGILIERVEHSPPCVERN